MIKENFKIKNNIDFNSYPYPTKKEDNEGFEICLDCEINLNSDCEEKNRLKEYASKLEICSLKRKAA